DMSKAKHNSYRKILTIKRYTDTVGIIPIKVTEVLWCLVNGETSRTIKTTHIMLTTYINGRKHTGIAGWMMRKDVSINKKNPMYSHFFDSNKMNIVKQESNSKAFASYIETVPNLTAKVI